MLLVITFGSSFIYFNCIYKDMNVHKNVPFVFYIHLRNCHYFCHLLHELVETYLFLRN